MDDPTHRGDPDGLIAAAGVAGLPQAEVELIGMVANRAPVRRRAGVLRYALDRHGARAPIGIGAELGEAREVELAPSQFESDPGMTAGDELCERVLRGRPAGSVRGFFTAPFREAVSLIERPDLWVFERIAVMGGVNRTADGWVPDSAFNNRLDQEAAGRFYRLLLKTQTSVTLVDRRFALWAKVPKRVWLDAADASDPWVAEMGRAMQRQWERMWDGVAGGHLPPDRTPEWYLDNWCDGVRPEWYRDWREGRTNELPRDITPYVTGAPAYDVLAVATLLEDESLGTVETHPAFPNFRVLRPCRETGPGKAVAAQLRIIRAAFGLRS